MRTLKIIALSSLFVFATASLAMACDGKKAETASAKASCSSSEVTTASADGAGCASKAAVKTASADGASCASKAAVKTASADGASCASKAAVETAGAACSSKAENVDMAEMAKAISVETVRMPSGALAVMYNGSCATSTGFLQASAEKGCEGFACSLAQGMAKDENLHTEMAMTEHGVMILVTSKDAKVLDKYEAEFAMATATNDEAGEE